jgi:TP901 family phage tail tape measure protein
MARKVGEVFVEVRANLSKLKAGMKSAIGIASGGASVIGKVLGGLARIIGATLRAAFKIVATAVKAVMTVVVTLFKSMIKWAKRGVLALTAFIAISVAVGAKFGQSMAKVKALTGASATDFKAMREEALRLGKATEFSATQAADAMGIFAMAGFKTNEIITAVAPTLDFAAASGLDMAEAADIAARVMGGMQLKATELTHATDVMTKAFTSANMDATDVGMAMQFVGAVGKTLGKDLEEVVGTITALAGAGIRGSMAGTGLRKVLMQLANKKVQGDLKAIGVGVTDTAGAMLPISQIIGDINRATQNMTDMEVADLGLQMFGARGGVAFLALLGQGEAAIRSHTEALRGADGLTKQIAGTMRDTMATSFKLVQSAAADLSIAVSDVFEPFIREGNENMVRFFNGFASLIRNNTGQLQTWIKDIRDWFTKDLPDYIYFAVGVLGQLFERFKHVLDRIGFAITAAKDKVGGAFSDFFELDQLEGGAFARVLQGLVMGLTKTFMTVQHLLENLARSFKLMMMKGEMAYLEWAANASAIVRHKTKGKRELLRQQISDYERTMGPAGTTARIQEGEMAEALHNALQFAKDLTMGAGPLGGPDTKKQGKDIVDIALDPLRRLFMGASTRDFEQRRDELIDRMLPFRGAFEGAVSRKPGAGRQVSMASASMEQVLAPAMAGTIQTALGTAKIGINEQVHWLKKITSASESTADSLDGAMAEA